MAAYSELFVEQYADFSTTVNVEDSYGEAIDLSGYSAASQLRKSYYSTTAGSFIATVTNAVTGEVTITMSSANTANMSPGRYLYDLVITSPANVKTRVVEGIVTILPGVTQ